MSLDVALYYENKPDQEVFSANITHNLDKMAEEAGFYCIVWRPEEFLERPLAKNIAPGLKNLLTELIENPKKYRAFSAPNGWGTYEQFVPWVLKYWMACCEHPEALVRVSR